MKLDQFKRVCNYFALLETEKVCHLAFFYLKTQQIAEFSSGDAAVWLVNAGGAEPNRARLDANLRASRNTVRAARGWRLKGSYIAELEGRHPDVGGKAEDIVDLGTVLPLSLYEDTRGYIVSLAKQINASYENNIFDGCAVLMRRLEEILLIHSYQKLNIDSLIKDGNGNYVMLEGIVSDAVNNTILALSRNSKKTIEEIRVLGNFSAHKITYTCKRQYIEEKIIEYRALIDELFHKSGIRS